MQYEKIYLKEGRPDVYLETYISDSLPNVTRKAILVIPGGGYGGVCADREGEPIALAFMPYGYNGFVLHYTVGRKEPYPAQLREVTLAIKHIKDNAEKYGIDPDQLFVTGFSAGGHCAAMCGTLWNHPVVREALGIDRGEAPEGINRPTATVLCYPVITANPFAHRGSIDTLCGYPSEDTDGAYHCSVELHVDKTTAPAFIWHTFNDTCVPIQNTLLYASALADAGVPFEYHVYPDGVHGLSLANRETWVGLPTHYNPTCQGWIDDAIRYVKEFKA